jgi:hypothetical protein
MSQGLPAEEKEEEAKVEVKEEEAPLDPEEALEQEVPLPLTAPFYVLSLSVQSIQ